ncbi:MAG: hypothetical protein HZA15_10650 [Nitrospirae bacterium]|nr:hypothetical protein [Nitrospirota bacterium]
MNDLSRDYDKLKGSALACIGYMLSPLSWWNDAYVNIPIAYACAWLVSLLYPNFFPGVFAGTYLLTNIVGFVLLQKGIARTLSKANHEKIRYNRRNLAKDIAISLCYTALMVLLVKTGIIKPPQHYFR